MKEAIKAEAQQRAQNMMQMAEEEASIERNRQVTAEKDRIEHEYHLKMKAEQVRAKMYSLYHSARSRRWSIRKG